MLASTFIILAGLISFSIAGYVLQDDYSPASFFSMFDFFTDADPTHGYVKYVDQGTAQSSGLINTNNNVVYMGVDSTNVATGSGRASVRITSKKSYNHGLIILDLAHMPGGICGTWPAFWTVGPGWPNSGEIDIIEGVNSQSSNAMTLHTGDGCSITNSGLSTGQITTPNCNVNAAGQATNAGCQIGTSNTNSYGAGFNAAQGGVYATEWTSDGISIWFFPRGSVPSDISSGWPNPSGWGMATAHFSGGCDIDTHFKNQQIVFDTTFCGDWAGNVWSTDSACSSKASTCQSFVQNNPSAFKDAYWSVNSLKVYSAQGGVSSLTVRTSGSSAASVSVPVSTPSTVASEGSSVSGGVVATPILQTETQKSQTRGGGGRHTGTWSAVNHAAAAVAASTAATDTAAASDKAVDVTPVAAVVAGSTAETTTAAAGAATYTSTSSDPKAPAPMALAVGTDGSVAEVPVSPADSSSVLATTVAISTSTATLEAPSTGTGSENVRYTTVSTMGHDNFPHSHHQPRAVEEGVEQQQAEALHERRNVHVHRHLHRHKHRGLGNGRRR